MFSFFKDLFITTQLKLESELRDRLVEKDSYIALLREENAQLRAKVEKMELTLVPGLAPAPPSLGRTAKVLPPVETSWQAYRRDFIEKMEAEEAKENPNGLQS